MTVNFYRAFEEKYRGSRDLIRSRLNFYRPFIEALQQICPGAPGLDLGCGRGEWLELLGEMGIAARGVDLDDAMLASCRRRGLDVQTQDALEALRQCADASQALVTGFHLAEHLPFDVLRELVQEAHRVLAPGGLLILETPNPENISVATNSFFLDPSHERPLPPQLLEFIPVYFGFAVVKIVRLQEDPALASRTDVTAVDLLEGVSPDYAVIAQKAGEGGSAIAAFEQDYGLAPAMLAARYQHGHERQAVRLEEVEARALHLEARMHQVEERALRLEVRANEMEARALRAEVRVVELETLGLRISAILGAAQRSWLWKIGRRLLAIRRALRRLLSRGNRP